MSLESQGKKLVDDGMDVFCRMASNNNKNGTPNMKSLVQALDLDIPDSLVDYVATPKASRREKLRQKYVQKTVVKYAKSVQNLRHSQTQIQLFRDMILGCEANFVMLEMKQKVLESAATTSSTTDKDGDTDNAEQDAAGIRNKNDLDHDIVNGKAEEHHKATVDNMHTSGTTNDTVAANLSPGVDPLQELKSTAVTAQDESDTEVETDISLSLIHI